MMVRSFLPVGQGAFYCETFESNISDKSIHVVYDCGSVTTGGNLKKIIKNHFQKEEEIQAVFISHLDEDHINGIPDLLRYCRVQRIYFPLISSDNIILMKIWFWINGINGFTLDFLVDPEKAIESLGLDIEHRPNLIQIREGDIQIDEMERVGREKEERVREGNLSEIDSGHNVFTDIKTDNNYKIPCTDWKYIPFNFRQDKRIKILMDELKNKFNRTIMKKELEQIWVKNYIEGFKNDKDKDVKTLIKEAYKNVPGNFNTNSMTLFSGEINNQYNQILNMHNGPYCCCDDHRPSGCLYTGDYDASGKMKWNQLRHVYDKYWESIGCIQIPHHGSKYNFNTNFLKIKGIFVISAGYSNKFKHPHSCVMEACMLKSIKPYVVTEDIGSAVYILIK